MRLGNRIRIATGLAALVVAAAACGSDSREVGGQPATMDAGEDVVVTSFSFTPAEIQAGAGETIAVRNANASTTHTFTVAGTEVDAEIIPLATVDVVVDLDPGAYEIMCRFHAQMMATLIVG